ncbi:hypothetical protein F7Q99_27815 [Streptomyces kaniharaensis]|uniref:Tetratricopeptide repeat protein n=1 Tax=Streptomyces kaniharaensis TaxID=212423 RepID=A0A6N7L072_9ACTN|nr:hypothetical protein [Streptomyces kaniharaensis]MQS15958.1 hypothetical protein [Streptomyces kaniharaensis]
MCFLDPDELWPELLPDGGEDSDEDEARIANLLGLLHARPDDVAVRRELGFELTGAKCWEVAVEVLSPAVELAPRDADVRLDLGCGWRPR